MLVAQGQSVGDRLGRGQRLQGGRAVQAEALGQLGGIYDKGAQLEFCGADFFHKHPHMHRS